MNMETDQIDSQFIAENIGFLDNCFDNSFILQSSLQVVKEQAAESNYYQESKGNERQCKKLNNYSQNSTVTLESTQNNSQTSRIVSNRNKKLRDWGLPLEIAKKYEARGITEMFEWQVNCLANSKVLFDCCNLVYSAPTSAGKTLVAEILTIKTILERQKKVIIILPFVSIVREKMFYLQDILSSSGIRVEGFMGSQSPPGGLQAVHVAVCTIEKANSLVNKLLDDGSIAELGAIIVDELHLLGDPSRGYILELLLTKIKYVSFNSDDVKVQIVGMSATLPNLKCLANWLNAELFITHFRPIPLDEYCLVGDKYYDKKGTCVNTVDMSLTTEGDNVLKICLETIKDGCSILIFCMTKNWCESLAQSVATSFYKLGCENGEAGSILRSQLKSMSIVEVLEQLKNCPVGLDQVLKKTISFGVAYHHAGLTFDERDIVEGGFKSGAIRVLVATSTLSSGVNLPARKVIIRSPVFQRQPINILTYKQMIGRAGRMGKDLKGESILICTEAERKIGFDLMMGNLDPVTSCIESEDKYMRAVLEMIASQVLTTKEQLDMYSKCTLLYNQQEATGTQDCLLENTLDELQNYELVRVQTDGEEERFVATPLGKACLSSSMAPNDGLSLFCELQKARQCLVLETDLHLIYLVTPYSVSSQWGNIDWIHMLTLWESLTKAMKRVGELVGVQESFIIRCLRGGNKANNIQNKINIHKRFYTALALQDLVNEVPLADVAAKFQCARGFLQSLQQGAATFAGMVTAFCHQLGWKNMEMLISQFQDRLHFGIHSELLELMKLPSLNGMRARTLFDSGFESIASIASADANTIENILHKSVPFQSEKGREDDDCDDIRKRNKIKSIWITGYCGITTKEAAENLIAEARRYLSLEIGVTEIKWDSKSSTSNFACSDNNVEMNNKIDEISSPLNIRSSAKIRTQSIGTQNSIKSNRAQCEQTLDKENVPQNVSTNTKPDLSMCALNRSTKGNKTLSYKNKDELSKTIVNISKEINKTVENISPSLSNDIIWDSLNFTDAGLDNISKLRTSDKMFSPNISFGEIEDKPEQENMNTSDILNSSKHVSAKDISLFSSEGDNTSLFEESLPLDLISSNFLDRGSPMPQDTALHYESINSNTILNAFKTTLLENERNDDDENEDIKLVYEDDKIIEKQDEEIDSNRIAVNCHKVHPNLVAHKRRQSANKEIQPLEKKKKVNISLQDDMTVSPKNKISFVPKIKSTLSKHFQIDFNQCSMNCFVLRGNDIIDNLHVIQNIQTASIYLHLKQNNLASNEIIGSNILSFPKSVRKVEDKSEYCPIKGIALYLNQGISIFLDLTTLNNMQMVKNKLRSWFKKKSLILKMLCSKTVNLYVKRWLDVNLSTKCNDISLTEWLIDSSEKTPDIEYLMKKYCGIDFTNILFKVANLPKKYKNLDTIESLCLRSYLLWMIAEKQEETLGESLQPAQNVIEIENQVSKILANCEYYGITVDKDLASRLLIDVRNSQESLEKKAYKLCGYHFNFNSSKDVAKVLGIYNGRKVSTKKSVLTSHNSPLSSTVIYWRKLNSILTKTLYPLTEKACIYSEGDRINPSYTMFTCTGRISMHEPNLQNVPRTFSIPCEYLTVHSAVSDEVVEFNCRNIFKSAPGYVIVSADYCQLEMRILTHFSQDQVLMKIMNSDMDVFKAIAASWSHVCEDEVDDDLRQKAKQLCYGIIYGMGNKTLGQLLDVTEMEAAVFMDSFYKTYPAVKACTQSIIEECRQRGYIETLTRRRRYLPDINSHSGTKRSAAERQAVNTTIQGSAADIAKAAMCSIDTKTDSLDPKPRLILQMHDELIYEVHETHQQYFVGIMKQVMEETVTLRVPLPVKVKTGLTWGSLKEIKFNES
ncbi:DNA polymerase theta [Spodoptera frugiperda]|uniref:DNA polymerase theta n=1 Tax=Spodoptera frugiperda TaxID=7108 RepID=A0A9R0D3L7_SPOFR|nr:DNA polymerase theta [Spodoptera frugiperda]